MIGSEFQARVWHALTKIPYGKTISYGEIAREVNSPKAVRAVGGAVGANLFSIIIPCHRVVKRDGEVSSAFAFGGANRQVELLKAEGVGFLDDSHADMKHCCVRALPLMLEE